MIQLLGDIAPTGLYVNRPQENSRRIEKILPLFHGDFIRFANLETPIFVENNQNPLKNKIHTTSYQALKDVLMPLRIDAVSLANNHIYDCQLAGIKTTIEALQKLGIKFTGAGFLPEHIEPILFENSGKKIAFMAYVDSSTNPKTENFSDLYINYFDLDIVKKDIQNILPKVDIIVCSIHWGTDYSFYPSPKQRNLSSLTSFFFYKMKLS
jgi:poly-gamma-glutamate synthesis protein (capsule biosynthesis protein)